MRKSPLKRTSAPKRQAPLPRVNRKRKRERFAQQFGSAEFVAFTRAQPSCISGNMGCVCSHSAKSRGAGGTTRDVVPLTPFEHEEEHRIGVTAFWAKCRKSPQYKPLRRGVCAACYMRPRYHRAKEARR